MSKELDKRIAIEVMGEPKPHPLGPPYKSGLAEILSTPNWACVEKWHFERHFCYYEWEPVPFSSDLDQAMTAVDKYFKDIKWEKPWLSIHYSPWPNVSPGEVWEATTFGGEDNDRSADGYGQTLPEAICNLLIALKGD